MPAGWVAAILWGMDTPEPDKRPFQFSLRSMLLLTVFVAVVCSIGVCTDWSVAAVIGVGGMTGGIVARSWRGLMLGLFVGGMGAFTAAAACMILGVLLFSGPVGVVGGPSWANGLIVVMELAAIIGSAIGGILGGRLARYRSER